MPHQPEKDEQVSPVIEMMREEARNFYRRVIDPNTEGEELLCRYMVDFHLFLNNRDGFEIQRGKNKDMYDAAIDKADEIFKKDIEIQLPLKRFELTNYIVWGMEWMKESKVRSPATPPMIQREESGVTDQPESEPAGLQSDEDVLDEAERKRKARKERRDRRKREAQEQENN